MTVSLENIRGEFPALTTKVAGKDLIYLDSGASTLKARSVIDSVDQVYLYEGANVHRGAHALSDIATEKYEAARNRVAQFINAQSSNEVIFTSGTTDSINLVASSFSAFCVESGDNIVITEVEHHSNIVPWQEACIKTGAELRYIPVNEEAALDLSNLNKIIDESTKLVAVNYISNATGVINPVEKIIQRARDVGAKVLIDAAQAMTVLKVDVQKLDCDFLAFSGHKMFAPNGIGILYGKQTLLNSMPPFKTGGSMIEKVTLKKTTYLEAPQRFEAGTPPIAGAIGLASAIKLIDQLGVEAIATHEKELILRLTEGLKSIPGVKIFGDLDKKISIVSFVIEGIHPSDIGSLLNQQGVAVRTGHHCCQPLMQALGVGGTIRASVSIYNNYEDVDRFIEALKKCREFL